MLKQDFAAKATCSYTSIKIAFRGEVVAYSTANAIAAAIGKPVDKLFNVTRDKRPLSEKTVQEHHRLISLILSQAEKEMLITYNPATKVINAPKRERSHTANYFEPEQLEQIRDCLEKEPLKWQVITHLLIVTGCRRGEIMGLKWAAVDLNKKQLDIRNNLLYAKDFGIYQDTTKTDTSTRIVPIPDETVELLRQYRKW